MQKNLLAATETISNAQQLEAVFNNTETFYKVNKVREARAKGDMTTADKVKKSLEGIIFVADDYKEVDHEFTIKENGEEKKVTKRVSGACRPLLTSMDWPCST